MRPRVFVRTLRCCDYLEGSTDFRSPFPLDVAGKQGQRVYFFAMGWVTG